MLVKSERKKKRKKEGRGEMIGYFTSDVIILLKQKKAKFY